MRAAFDDPPPDVIALVLAAGAGRRFAGPWPKLAAPLAARSLLHHALRSVAAAGFVHVVVVTGALRLVDLDPSPPDGVVELRHAGWAGGLATSLQVGLRSAAHLGARAVVVGLGDQPGVPPSAWRAVAARDAAIAVATYAGRRGNPVRLDAAIWPLLPTDGDEGARVLMRARSDLVVEVACDGDPRDVDTREDLDALG
jgi:molybdenum cofactor cytidylyltransferase